MGNGRIEIAVADAGPLIHLAEIGCLSLLRIFALLHIPEMVWAETVGQGRVTEDDVLKLGNIERQYPIQAEVIQFVKTFDWKKYEIFLDVPQDSVGIAFGILLNGQGQVWIDDLNLEVVGEDVPTTNLKVKQEVPEEPINLNFESE
ncbi:MAG: hypothetical protein ACREBU_15975 [Nitrososphaera sp.]